MGLVLDRLRSPAALRWENALLRKQLEVACRQVRRPRLRRTDRVCLALFARLTPSWRDALLLIKPETILRWHRQGFALLWHRRSKRGRAFLSRISDDTIALIQRMAGDNALWGAERIRGELLKLGIRVSKRTVQKYLHRLGPPRPRGVSWATFLRAHGHEIWACDFLQVYDLLFRPIFAFFIIDLSSRRVVHSAVTRSPSSAWVTQQLREATAWGEGPRFLIRDNDGKFGSGFDALARATGIQILRTPVRAPNANAICERFLRSVRAECLDHLIILGERSLASIASALLPLLQQRATPPRCRTEGARRAGAVRGFRRCCGGDPGSRRSPPRVSARRVGADQRSSQYGQPQHAESNTAIRASPRSR